VVGLIGTSNLELFADRTKGVGLELPKSLEGVSDFVVVHLNHGLKYVLFQIVVLKIAYFVFALLFQRIFNRFFFQPLCSDNRVPVNELSRRSVIVPACGVFNLFLPFLFNCRNLFLSLLLNSD